MALADGRCIGGLGARRVQSTLGTPTAFFLPTLVLSAKRHVASEAAGDVKASGKISDFFFITGSTRLGFITRLREKLSDSKDDPQTGLIFFQFREKFKNQCCVSSGLIKGSLEYGAYKSLLPEPRAGRKKA